MICWARYSFWLLIAVLGIGNMVTACGHKGDLYVPKAEPAKAEQAVKPKAESD